jgi:hypothetical protein
LLLTFVLGAGIATAFGVAGCTNTVSLPEGPGSQPSAVGAGSLVGVAYGASGARIVHVDPASGAVTPLVELPQKSLAGGAVTDAAYDRLRRRYTFLYFDAGDGHQHAVSVDLASGSVVADVVLAAEGYGLTIDPSTGSLSLQTHPATAPDGYTVTTLDPANGAESPVGSWPGYWVFARSDGIASDGAGKYFYAVPSNDTATAVGAIFTFDVATQASAQAQSAVVPFDVDFDPHDKRLVGLTTSPFRVVGIDPASGQTQTIATLSELGHAFVGDGSLDAEGRRYFFVGASGEPLGGSMWVTGNRIYTVNVDTGEVLGSSPTLATDATISVLRYAD